MQKRKLSQNYKEKNNKLQKAQKIAERLSKEGPYYKKAALLRTTRLAREIAEIKFKRLARLLQKARSEKRKKDIETELAYAENDFLLTDSRHRQLKRELKEIKEP